MQMNRKANVTPSDSEYKYITLSIKLIKSITLYIPYVQQMLVNKCEELFHISGRNTKPRFLFFKNKQNKKSYLKVTAECLIKVTITSTFRLKLEVAADLGFIRTFQHLPSHFCVQGIACLTLCFRLQNTPPGSPF